MAGYAGCDCYPSLGSCFRFPICWRRLRCSLSDGFPRRCLSCLRASPEPDAGSIIRCSDKPDAGLPEGPLKNGQVLRATRWNTVVLLKAFNRLPRETCLFRIFLGDQRTAARAPGLEGGLRGEHNSRLSRRFRRFLRLVCDDRQRCRASALTVVDYIAATEGIRAPATIQRRLCGIAKVRKLLGHEDPTHDESVRLAVRRMLRRRGRRQKQALGLVSGLREKLMDACGEDRRGLCDRAIIAVGYDTLCRCSELIDSAKEGSAIYPPPPSTGWTGG